MCFDYYSSPQQEIHGEGCGGGDLHGRKGGGEGGGGGAGEYGVADGETRGRTAGGITSQLSALRVLCALAVSGCAEAHYH